MQCMHMLANLMGHQVLSGSDTFFSKPTALARLFAADVWADGGSTFSTYQCTSLWFLWLPWSRHHGKPYRSWFYKYLSWQSRWAKNVSFPAKVSSLCITHEHEHTSCPAPWATEQAFTGENCIANISLQARELQHNKRHVNVAANVTLVQLDAGLRFGISENMCDIRALAQVYLLSLIPYSVTRHSGSLVAAVNQTQTGTRPYTQLRWKEDKLLTVH